MNDSGPTYITLLTGARYFILLVLSFVLLDGLPAFVVISWVEGMYLSKMRLLLLLFMPYARTLTSIYSLAVNWCELKLGCKQVPDFSEIWRIPVVDDSSDQKKFSTNRSCA